MYSTKIQSKAKTKENTLNRPKSVFDGDKKDSSAKLNDGRRDNSKSSILDREALSSEI
jgi:hypothetical protein